ncbi:MAG: ribulose-phosphate 3-epimerase [bacterium]
MKKTIISPSLLSADFLRLSEQLGELKAAGADTLHVDVMDGWFVPNISFGQVVVASINEGVPIPMDVHLMVQDPERYLDKYNLSNVNDICVHPEATRHLDRALQVIKGFGKRASVALNPSTPLSAIEWALDRLDMIMIMTVNPGFGGQSFIPAMLPKIEAARKMADSRGLDIIIGVDGGVNGKNAGQIVSAGAEYLVAGNFVFSREGSIAKAMEVLRRETSRDN